MSPQGFGEPSKEFWLGNEFIYRLTNQQSYKLRIELSDWEGNSGFSQYDQFSLESEAQNYRYVFKLQPVLKYKLVFPFQSFTGYTAIILLQTKELNEPSCSS